MPTTSSPRFILASASPARRKLLRAAGIEPEVLVSGVDESTVTTDEAGVLCLELARLKAEAVTDGLGGAGRDGAATGTGATGRTLVLGCDSVLSFEGQVLGKPTDADDATKRWHAMRGRSGVLYTGHCLIEAAEPTPAGAGRAEAGWAAGRRAEAVAATTVHFADIGDEEIAAYVATGEPLQVAGAFTIDGLGGPFVERVEGDPGTVVGLSLPLLRTLLAQLDVRITDLWTDPKPGGEAAPAEPAPRVG